MTDDRYPLGLFGQGYACDQHTYEGVLPCPWPSCPNGAGSSQIVGLKPGRGSERSFARFQYTSATGEERFLWADDLGSFFPAGARAHMEMKRSGVLHTEPAPTLIYHYTEPSALLGILESQEIWLTDYAYLNDSKEVEHGLALSRTILENYSRAHDSDSGLSTIVDAARDEMNRIDGRRFAVACFSAKGDSLPQWRAYGPLAIGFSVGGPTFGYAPEAIIDRVVYDHDIQYRQVLITVHEHIEAVSIDRQIGRSDDPELLGAVLAGRLVQRIGFFKDRSFSEEQEVRYCFVEDANTNAKLSFPVAPKRFRSRGKSIVPYLGSSDIIYRDEMCAEPPPSARLPIAEVVIGPGDSTSILARGVRELLDYHGYRDAIVRHSVVPYRTF